MPTDGMNIKHGKLGIVPGRNDFRSMGKGIICRVLSRENGEETFAVGDRAVKFYILFSSCIDASNRAQLLCDEDKA